MWSRDALWPLACEPCPVDLDVHWEFQESCNLQREGKAKMQFDGTFRRPRHAVLATA